MKKNLIKIMVVSALLGLTFAPSFSTTAKHTITTQREIQNMGTVTQRGYIITVIGNPETGQITGMQAHEIATGLDVDVLSWKGYILRDGNTNRVVAKVFLENIILQVNGILG